MSESMEIEVQISIIKSGSRRPRRVQALTIKKAIRKLIFVGPLNPTNIEQCVAMQRPLQTDYLNKCKPLCKFSAVVVIFLSSNENNNYCREFT